jgi:hypothetical protein
VRRLRRPTSASGQFAERLVTERNGGGPLVGHAREGMGPPRRYGLGELVEVPGLGAGSYEPATKTQAHDLIIFDKKNPPRDEERRSVFRVKAESRKPVCDSRRRKERGRLLRPRKPRTNLPRLLRAARRLLRSLRGPRQLSLPSRPWAGRLRPLWRP